MKAKQQPVEGLRFWLIGNVYGEGRRQVRRCHTLTIGERIRRFIHRLFV